MAEISISIENKYFGVDNNIIATFSIKSCILINACKIPVATAFLRENAVKAIQASLKS